MLTVKYTRDILINNNICIDFTVTSCFSRHNFSSINPNETETISVDVTENNSTKDIIFKKVVKTIL